MEHLTFAVIVTNSKGEQTYYAEVRHRDVPDLVRALMSVSRADNVLIENGLFDPNQKFEILRV